MNATELLAKVKAAKAYWLAVSLIVLAGVAIAINLFAGTFDRLRDRVRPEGGTFVQIPELPGGSGWIFLGSYNMEMKAAPEKPLFDFVDEAKKEQLLPKVNDRIRLLTSRKLMIMGFKKTNIERLNEGPTLKVPPNDAYTGITLLKGSIVEVRDIALGPPGQDSQLQAVWIRIGKIPE